MADEDAVRVTERRDLKPSSKIARRFAELVGEGKSPKAAAGILRVDLGDPGNYAVANEVQQLIRGYASRPEIDRELVRASRRKILIDAMTGQVPDHGLALDAAKQIASDPDVGLNAPPAPLVSLTFGSIEEILERLDEKDVILEVTAESVGDENPEG